MTLGVCITTLNESESIAWIVRYFIDRGHKVYVVDDGSEDDTALKATLAGAVVTLRNRAGIGPCLLEAWRMALADVNCTHILQIDAGFSHRPEGAARLIGAALHIPADVVVGSRFMKGSYYNSLYGSRVRPYLSRLATLMCNYAQSGAKYTDWTSGYRVFSRRAAEYLIQKPYQARMHGWQIEVLAYAGEAGFTVVEEPISYTGGKSSFNRAVAHEALMTWLHIIHNVGWVGSRLNKESV